MNLFSKVPIREVWKLEWNMGMAIRIILIVCIAALMLIFAPSLILYAQSRQGTQLNDPLLTLLPSADLSWFIFPILHISLITGLVSLIHYPRQLVIMLEAYLLATFLRMMAIYFVPLEPPVGLVILTDYLNDSLFYSHTIITKDLFFSGHTTTIVILYLTAVNPFLKKLFFFLTIVIAGMLLIQHIHYSLDIVGAVFFTWLSYFIVISLEKRFSEPAKARRVTSATNL